MLNCRNRAIVVLALTVGILASLYSLWYPKGMLLTLGYVSTDATRLAVYYGESSESFSEKRKVTTVLDKRSGTVEIPIRTKKLDRLRIDIGENSTKILFHDIVLKGDENISVDTNIRAWTPHSLKLFENDGFGIVLGAGDDMDPYAVYRPALNSRAKRHRVFIWDRFFMILIGSFLISCLLVDVAFLTRDKLRNKEVPKG